MVVEAYRKPEYAEDLKNASVIFSDGWPVAKTMSIFYRYKQERIAGMDFILDFLKAGNEKGLTLFLFGSTEDIITPARQRIQNEFPGINVSGHICPPFDENWDNAAYIEKINDSNPHVVLVALGCPKQEMWMSRHYKEINSMLLGIGAALPVFAGVMTRCPQWLRDNGMEWAFRLLQEPRRLFKRYFISNFIFIYLFMKELFLIKLGIKTIPNNK